MRSPPSLERLVPAHREWVAGVPVHPLSSSEAIQIVIGRALGPDRGATVVLTNANTAYQAHREPALKNAVEEAFLSFPDGMSMVWILRRRGHSKTEKVTGREFMPELVEAGVPLGIRHLLYGGMPGVAEQAAEELLRRAPDASVTAAPSPPLAEVNDWPMEELQVLVASTQPHILWVGLGAPKQEILMARMARLLDVPVLMGVGAAFNFLAGSKRSVPKPMSNMGLEWLFRLITEPRRLWRRYLFGNATFLYLLAREAVGDKRSAA